MKLAEEKETPKKDSRFGKEQFKDFVVAICLLWQERAHHGENEAELKQLSGVLQHSENCNCEPFLSFFSCGGNDPRLDIYCDKLGGYLRASYYDGFTTPYMLLSWKADAVEELYSILKEQFPALYERVQDYLERANREECYPDEVER